MMAQALEENGAKVYIIGRRLEVLEKAAKTAKHGKIIPLKGDVTSKDDLQAIVDHITKEDGFINVCKSLVFRRMSPFPSSLVAFIIPELPSKG